MIDRTFSTFIKQAEVILLVKLIKNITVSDESDELEELVAYGENVLARVKEAFGARAAYAQVLSA